MAEPLLLVAGLHKEFEVGRLRRQQTIHAVRGVSFQIAEGETLGLVGESGSGKSTVGRLVLRLVDASAGSVRFTGKEITTVDPTDLRRLRRDMQVVFQDPQGSFNPRKRVGQILREPLRLHGIAKDDQVRRISQAIEDVGLQDSHLARFPHQLSGGQRQRVAIARALVLQPRFIVADEPVSALDVSVQAQVLNLMRDLQDEHDLTYLFISHDLSVVRFMSQRIVVMYLGEFVEEGATETVYLHPAHPYTQILISSIPGQLDAVQAAADDLEDEAVDNFDPGGTACGFAPRCPFAQERCWREKPLLRNLSDDQRVACHYAEDIKASMAPQSPEAALRKARS